MSHKISSPRQSVGRALTTCGALLLLLAVVPPAKGQFVGMAVGRQLSETLTKAASSGEAGGPQRSQFDNGALISVDAAFPVVFPYVSAGLHYSFSDVGLTIDRGDSFGSRAEADLKGHTVTGELRLRTPSVRKFRLFGLAGAGFTRFGLDVSQQVESPFPGGAPNHLTSFLVTYGGGFERHLHQLFHLRLEVRDYVAPVPDQLFRPGGAWHRVVVLGGITVGL